MLSTFIATLDPGDTSCADEPAAGWWVPGSFPKSMASAPKAKQTSGPAASPAIRSLATVSAWTVMDGFMQSQAAYANNHETPDAIGLRGGTVHVDFDPNDGAPTLTYDAARFTTDVALSGSFVWTGTIDGAFTASGAAPAATQVQVSGPMNVPGEVLTLTIEVRGQPATFEVPSF